MKNKHLTAEGVAHLDGRPIKLSSSFSEGKLLTISPTGKTTLEYPDTGFDQQWHLIPESDGFILSSSQKGDMICHNVEDKGIVQARPLSDETKDCVWKVGKTGEIYQKNPAGGERYLWLADDKLFVILDGFLAESWTPISDIEQPSPPPPVQKKKPNYSLLVYGAIFTVLLLIIYSWARKIQPTTFKMVRRI